MDPQINGLLLNSFVEQHNIPQRSNVSRWVLDDLRQGPNRAYLGDGLSFSFFFTCRDFDFCHGYDGTSFLN